jgi:hypothetical protein
VTSLKDLYYLHTLIKYKYSPNIAGGIITSPSHNYAIFIKFQLLARNTASVSSKSQVSLSDALLFFSPTISNADSCLALIILRSSKNLADGTRFPAAFFLRSSLSSGVVVFSFFSGDPCSDNKDSIIDEVNLAAARGKCTPYLSKVSAWLSMLSPGSP